MAGNNFETLDPKDWEKSRLLLHQMVDDAIDYLSTIRERPIWQPMPETVLDYFKEGFPQEPSNPEKVYQEFTQFVLPYPMGNVHPNFWAWYMGNGTLSGVMGDFWASLMNPNLGGGNHAANQVEEQVINWMKSIMSFPVQSSGLLVSGGSMANFVGLAVARNTKAGFDIRNKGLRADAAQPMAVYASTEVHSCNQKALELLGLGAESLRKIAVKADYSIDIAQLRKQIIKDRQDGIKPICIIGTSGTVNTGAIDDLPALADIAEEEKLWFHVDGAIGAIAILSDAVKDQLTGIERADSVALDLHKWLHMPFEAGCVLIKNEQAHKNTFSLIPEYLAKNTRGVGSGKLWFSEYGLQLSRRFRALKIWMSLKEHGTKKFGRMISRNVEQAHYLGKKINQASKLELVAPIGLDIVCFRLNPGGLSQEKLNKLNQEIKLRLEEAAIAIPGYTTLSGKYCIRVAIANHRSTTADFDYFVHNILAFGEKKFKTIDDT